MMTMTPGARFPRIRALATDYDGTLADRGVVDDRTWDALKRFQRSGRRLVLVTGRELGELLALCPRIAVFDRVVVENGGLLYRPLDQTEQRLAAPPDAAFVATLRARGVGPIAVGRTIVATWQPHAPTVEAVIQEQNLPLRVTLNKRAVMILPDGVDKASGLIQALREMDLTPHDAAGVGDAENDLAFLRICGRSAAVANALPALRDQVERVTQGERGAGVAEWIDLLLADGSVPEA